MGWSIFFAKPEGSKVWVQQKTCLRNIVKIIFCWNWWYSRIEITYCIFVQVWTISWKSWNCKFVNWYDLLPCVTWCEFPSQGRPQDLQLNYAIMWSEFMRLGSQILTVDIPTWQLRSPTQLCNVECIWTYQRDKLDIKTWINGAPKFGLNVTKCAERGSQSGYKCGSQS